MGSIESHNNKDKALKTEEAGEAAKDSALHSCGAVEREDIVLPESVQLPDNHKTIPSSKTIHAVAEENSEEYGIKTTQEQSEDKPVAKDEKTTVEGSNTAVDVDANAEAQKTQPIEIHNANNESSDPEAEAVVEKPSKKGPSHAAHARTVDVESGVPDEPENAQRHRKSLKRLTIALVSLLGALAVCYFVGAFIFTGHVMPNTYIDNSSISMMDTDKLEAFAQNEVNEYELKVHGLGLDLELDAKQIGLKSDGRKFSSDVMHAQDPWLWPFEMLQHKNDTELLYESLSADKVKEAIEEPVLSINDSAAEPANAYISYDPTTVEFSIIPEVPGSIVNADAVTSASKDAALKLVRSVELDDSALIEPTILSDDPKLLKALNDAQSIQQHPLAITLGGGTVEVLGPETVGPWIRCNDDLSISIDEEAVRQWVHTVSAKYNTVGKARTYTRPDGKQVSVSGGTYGWRVNNESLVSQIVGAVGTDTRSIEIPAEQQGMGYSGQEGRDWGPRYVDVDLSEQHARFYDDTGNLVWEAPIVSGAAGKNDTPTGVYKLNAKQTNMMLRGPMVDGEYAWESHVNYWMPFKGSSFGLHDANWQSAFGGSRYRQGFGSHGCVNLPYESAQALYGMIQVGDVIVVHY